MSGAWVVLELAREGDAGSIDAQVLRRHGGRLMAHGVWQASATGATPAPAMVILRFPTGEDVRRWRADPDWRAPTGLGRLTVVPGAEPHP